MEGLVFLLEWIAHDLGPYMGGYSNGIILDIPLSYKFGVVTDGSKHTKVYWRFRGSIDLGPLIKQGCVTIFSISNKGEYDFNAKLAMCQEGVDFIRKILRERSKKKFIADVLAGGEVYTEYQDVISRYPEAIKLLKSRVGMKVKPVVWESFAYTEKHRARLYVGKS